MHQPAAEALQAARSAYLLAREVTLVHLGPKLAPPISRRTQSVGLGMWRTGDEIAQRRARRGRAEEEHQPERQPRERHVAGGSPGGCGWKEVKRKGQPSAHAMGQRVIDKKKCERRRIVAGAGAVEE